jgi:hypothetical protein
MVVGVALAALSGAAQADEIVSWGSNIYGGIDTPEGCNFVDIDSMYHHGLALTDVGEVFAWGARGTYDYGQGYTPPPPLNENVVDIGTGSYHSIVLYADGSLYAWGNNDWGQLDIPEPNTAYVEVKAGGGFNYARRANGDLEVWGRNHHGQLDYPTEALNAVEFYPGIHHVLALMPDGSLIAWGLNDDGQCDVPSGSYINACAGYWFSLGVRADGTIAAWGHDSNPCVTKAPTDGGYVAVAGYIRHAIALKEDGTLVAWGDDIPAVYDTPTDAGYTQIAAGESISFALKPCALSLDHHWPFDCTYDDIAGGLVPDVFGTQMVVGQVGMGVEFDGDDEYINSHFVPQLDVEDSMSIAFWVRTPDGPPPTTDYMLLGLERRYHQEISLRIRDGSGFLSGGWGDDSGNAGWMESTSSICDGRWHHVVMIIDRAMSTTSLYVDGGLVDSDDAPPGPINLTNARELTFGKSNHDVIGPFGSFDEALDDIRIYRGVLSQQEILGLLPHWMRCPADLNRDGVVDQADLGTLLADYGSSCP